MMIYLKLYWVSFLSDHQQDSCWRLDTQRFAQDCYAALPPQGIKPVTSDCEFCVVILLHHDTKPTVDQSV